MNKDHIIQVEYVDRESVRILGKLYYTQDFVEEQIRRSHQNGLREGRTVHIAQVEECTNCRNNKNN